MFINKLIESKDQEIKLLRSKCDLLVSLHPTRDDIIKKLLDYSSDKFGTDEGARTLTAANVSVNTVKE